MMWAQDTSKVADSEMDARGRLTSIIGTREPAVHQRGVGG